MPIIARTVGGPGAGKTTRALQIIEMVLDKLVSDPLRIGFVSFTRAARREAAERAATKFNIPLQLLEKEGWFRTIHSVCHRCLGIQAGELLVGEQEDNEWLKNVLGDEKAVVSGRQDDDMFSMPSDVGESGRALMLWDSARNRQVTLESVWDAAYEGDSRLPDLSLCQSVVTVYEAAKREAGRYDFCDLLMRFAGKRWSGNHAHPFADVEPEGYDPGVPVWLHDEAQDASYLTYLVFQRLTRFATWVYLFLDEYQAIYEFAGADGKIFGRCEVAKEEILPISYRCPSNILACADQIMLRGGHKPRPFRSNAEGGEVLRSDMDEAIASVRCNEPTLVLARTNDYAKRAAMMLDDLGLPWIPTKGNGGFNAPARAAGVAALVMLQNKKSIDAEGMFRLTQLLPAKADGVQLFERGTKSKWDDAEYRKQVSHSLWGLGVLDMCGATDTLKEIIASGRYVSLLDKPAARMATAAQKHGIEAVTNPKIRVGTMHSSKGSQADHVVLVNRIPYPTAQAVQTEAGLEGERRVFFVTASRASKKLTIAEGDGEPFPDI